MSDENHYAPMDGDLLAAALAAAFGVSAEECADQDVPSALVRALIDHLEERKPDDTWAAWASELRLWLRERRTCPKCAGECFVTMIDLERPHFEGWQSVRCPECGGRGDVALERVAPER